MQKILKISLLLVVVLVIIYWLTANGVTAYFYASLLEYRWVKAEPKTKPELEQYLYLYSTEMIQPSQSMWGWDYELKNDEKMVQYLLLWKAPLDVVYDSNDNIKMIYTSYE
jgi:hypothetical protein